MRCAWSIPTRPFANSEKSSSNCARLRFPSPPHRLDASAEAGRDGESRIPNRDGRTDGRTNTFLRRLT